MFLKNQASAHIKKERFTPITKSRMKNSLSKFVKKGGVRTESKALGKSIIARID